MSDRQLRNASKHSRTLGLRSRTSAYLSPPQPPSDRPELLVDLTLPQNASIYATDTVAQRFDAALEGDADVARWSTYVGRGAIRFYLPLNVQLPNDFFAQAVIVPKDVAARERVRIKLEKILADEFPSLVGRVYPACDRGCSAIAEPADPSLGFLPVSLVGFPG